MLGLRIQRAGGLVEQQNAGLFEDRARNGDALFLTAGQLEPPFADLGVEAVRQTGDKGVQVGQTQHLVNRLLARLGIPVGNVVAQRVVEQHGVLWDHADVATQAGLAQPADIVAADPDHAGVHVVETEDQASKRGFAGAAGTDHRNGLPGGDLQAHALKNRAAAVVTEMHVFEGDGGRCSGQIHGRLRVLDLRLDIREPKHATDVGQCLFDLPVDEAQEIQRHKQLQHVRVDQHQIAQCHGARDDLATGQNHHHRYRCAHDEGLTEIKRGQ